MTSACAARAGSRGKSSAQSSPSAQESESTHVSRVLEDVKPLLDENKIREAVRRVDRGIEEAESDPQVFQLRMTNIRILLSATLQGKVDEKMLRRQADSLLDETSGRRAERAYLITGKVNAALGSYDRAKELLEQYLDEYPEPPASEAKRYKRANNQSHPRIMYRFLARRMLDKVQMVGEQVPDFEVKTIDGKTRTPESYRGKVWLLNFWSTSSEPSRKELPNLKSIYVEHDGDFAILGLSMDNRRKKLTSFVNKYDIGWDQAHVGQGSFVPNRFSVQSLPATFLMDEEGTVRAVGVRGKRLRNKVTELLND